MIIVALILEQTWRVVCQRASISRDRAMDGSSCWGCGRVSRPTRASPFQVCTLCIQEGCEPCVFCTPECLRAAMPQHKEFHHEKRRLYALAEQVAARHWESAAAASSIASPYDDLLAAANSMTLGGANAAASTAFDGAAGGAPSQSDLQQAAQEYVLAVERTAPAAGAVSLHWAERAIAAYALCSNQSELSSMARPSWWKDDALKAMSASVLAARPDFVLAWRLRGEVLSALLGGASWVAAPRSAAELLEAGKCLQRAATFGSDELAVADKEKVVRQAVACLKAAQAAEAERQARQSGVYSAASSGTSTPTGGLHCAPRAQPHTTTHYKGSSDDITARR